MTMRIDIVNEREVMAAIVKETDRTKEAGFKIIAETALHTMNMMKRLIRPSVITGRLRASVHPEKGSARFNVAGLSGGGNFPAEDQHFSISPKENEVIVGTNVIYANSVEKHGRARGYFRNSVRSAEEYMDKKLKQEASR